MRSVREILTRAARRLAGRLAQGGADEAHRGGARALPGSRSVLPFDDLAADRSADVLVARENARAPISTADA